MQKEKEELIKKRKQEKEKRLKDVRVFSFLNRKITKNLKMSASSKPSVR